MTAREGMRLVIAGLAEILLGGECMAIQFPATGVIVRWPGRTLGDPLETDDG